MTNAAATIELSKRIAQDAQALAETVAHTAPAHAMLDPLMVGITVLMLACFVGYFVVWRVTPALHTPLMAVTNAISGIVVIGAMLALGSGMVTDGSGISQRLGFVAVFLASINIFGGFVITQRMLHMFRQKKK